MLKQRSELKKQGMKSISTSTMIDILEILGEYLPYTFKAFKLTEEGILKTEESSSRKGNDQPEVKILVLESGLACTLNSNEGLLRK